MKGEAQYFIGLRCCLELFSSLWGWVLVGMALNGNLPVGFLDVPLRGIWADTKDIIEL